MEICEEPTTAQQIGSRGNSTSHSTMGGQDASNQSSNNNIIVNDAQLSKRTSTGTSSKNDCRVQVAVRVRPFINMELINCESSCVKTRSNGVIIGSDKDFEFDKVIDQDASQEDVYTTCMSELLDKSFEGYNATVLAYGQTGSGKTHTMGTSNLSLNDADEMGILPRVIREIFRVRREKEKSVEMVLKISYFEIYNDNIIDLLDANLLASASQQGQQSKKAAGGGKHQHAANVFIREEVDGSINLYGITEEKVNSPEEMLAALERGGMCRSTSATLMNQTSSRSHAVFTIFLEQHSIGDLFQQEGSDKQQADQVEEGFKTSKLHFVDLAGSERLKRTGAVGATMKEGININMGLLSLGNVISALTEPNPNGKKHIPYRDSKLTRILQDSLGGNSNTLMIACISPADSNFEESLNTLKYASRARRIKNKPVVNRDPQSALISSLKSQLQGAAVEISQLRALLDKNGIAIPDTISSSSNKAMQQSQFGNDFMSSSSSVTSRNSNKQQDQLLFKANMSGGGGVAGGGGSAIINLTDVDIDELKSLRLNLVRHEKRNKELIAENNQLKSVQYKSEITSLTMQKERDDTRLKLERVEALLKKQNLNLVELLRQDESNTMEVESAAAAAAGAGIDGEKPAKTLVEEYREQMERMKKELNKKDVDYRELQAEFEDGLKASLRDEQMLIEREKKIAVLNRQLREKIKKQQKSLQENQKSRKVTFQESSSNKMVDEEEEAKRQSIEFQSSSLKQDQQHDSEDTSEDEEDDELDADDMARMASDPEFVKMESQLKLEENQKKWTLSKVDGSINESNERMRRMNSEQLVLQQQLLQKMKEQYHSKITHLESDMRRMEVQRDEALNKLSSSSNNSEKQKVIESFKLKVTDMQSTLNEFKRKAREQEQLQRTVSTQEKQISQLGSEIATFKQVKAKLFKEMKKNTEEFEKFKQKKFKDIMAEKKKGIMKEKQIFRLQNQTKKQERLLAKKTQDIKQLIRARDLIKKIVASGHGNTNRKGMMKRVKKSQQQQQSSTMQGENGEKDASIDEKLNGSHNSSNDVDVVVEKCLCKLIESIEISLSISKAEAELAATQIELEEVQNKSIEFKLALEKQERSINADGYGGMSSNSNGGAGGSSQAGVSVEQEQQLYSQRMELEEIQSRLESLEAKYEFKRHRIEQLYADSSSVSFADLQDQLLASQQYNNIPTQKIIVKSLLERFGASATEILRLTESNDALKVENHDAQQFIRVLQSQSEIYAMQMQSQMQQLENKLRIAQSAQNIAANNNNHAQADSDSDGDYMMVDEGHDMMSHSGQLHSQQQLLSHRRFNKNKNSPPKSDLLYPSSNANNKFKQMRLAHQLEQSPFKQGPQSAQQSGQQQPPIKNEDQVKQLTKSNHDLMKLVKQYEMRLKTLQNRNETLHQKYDDLRRTTCKDKFIGISKQNEEEFSNGFSNGFIANTNNNSMNAITGVAGVAASNPSFPLTPGVSNHHGGNSFFPSAAALNVQTQATSTASNTATSGSLSTSVAAAVAAVTAGNMTSQQSLTSLQQPLQLGNALSAAKLPNLNNASNNNNSTTTTTNNNNTNNNNNQNSSSKDVAIMSLRDRRQQIKNKSDDIVPNQSGNAYDAREEKNLLSQYAVLDRVTNADLNTNNNTSTGNLLTIPAASKQKAHSIAAKRSLLNEARAMQKQSMQQQSQQTGTTTDGTNRGRQVNNLNINKWNLMVEEIQGEAEGTHNSMAAESPFGTSENYYNSNPFSPAATMECEDPMVETAQNHYSDHNQSIQAQLTTRSSQENEDPQQQQQYYQQQQMYQQQQQFQHAGVVVPPANTAPPINHFKYECVGRISDAHSGQIFCVQSHENLLFSTSVKTLKIWDLENLRCISDIQVHNHFVKGLAVIGSEKWIATACDKYINLWDMMSLQKICMLTGHNADIKQLHFDESTNVLYSAGKGANNAGALVTWDLRKQQAIDEREKNQDIFAVMPWNNVIYYASRDHYVRRIQMDLNGLSMDPFKPPHYDAVTSLAMLNGYLVSGSKDHNLKLWGIHSNDKFKEQTYYSSEQINCLESNVAKNLLYVGQKDGKVKVISTTAGGKFRDIAEINNGLGSVNCVTRVDSAGWDNVFACGTADKVIKIWKPTADSNEQLLQQQMHTKQQQDGMEITETE